MKIHFILVDPKVPENIGFVCRSLKNMGFESLRVVNSDKHTKNGARNTAYQAHDILDNIQSFKSLGDAIHDMDLTIGTTAKDRTQRKEYLLPSELPGLLASKNEIVANVAIVFGGEESGLSKEDIGLCDVLSHIPMAISYPSINLSHSVMIYAYELSKSTIPDTTMDSSDKESIQTELLQRSDELLKALQVDTQPVLYNRIKERIALCSNDDSKLILSLLRHVKRAVNN